MAEISLCVFRQNLKKEKKKEVAKRISIPYKYKNKLSPWESARHRLMFKKQQILPWLLCSTQSLWTTVHALTQPQTILKHTESYNLPVKSVDSLSEPKHQAPEHKSQNWAHTSIYTGVSATAATTAAEAA